MNKGVTIGIIIIFLLFLGFGVYNVTNKSASKGNQETTQKNTSEPENADTTIEKSDAPSSLRELLSSGQSQRCTFNSATDDTATDGTIFAASGKMRGDISTTTSEKSVMSHMIFRDDQFFMWMDGETNGMKMTFDPNNIQDEETTQKTVDLDETIDYQCTGWAGDSSVFDVPSDVIFTSFDSLALPSIPSTGSSSGTMGDGASSCAACEQLTGEAKDQCLTALECE